MQLEPFAFVAEPLVAAQQAGDHRQCLVLPVALHHGIDAQRACIGHQRSGARAEHRPTATHVVELHDALCDVERMVIGEADHACAEHDVVGPLRRTSEEHLG